MENTIDAAMEDPTCNLIPIEKKNNTDAEETDMKKINTAAIKETGAEADDVKLVESAYIYLTKREYPFGCTKFSPFEVMFSGRRAVLPIDLTIVQIEGRDEGVR